MITLYELHWSHYCEKVRLALNYLDIAWRAVQIDAFSKHELKIHPLPAQLPNHTVPAIHDATTDSFVLDSTPILRHLDAHHSGARRLFPGDEDNRRAIDAKLLEFDTSLGLAARRFAYTQVILECPSLLADLFLHGRAGGFYCRPGIRRISGAVVGMLLTKRFDFHRSEALHLYEALEDYLLRLTDELATREFVVGTAMSAADLALAALLRPLTIVPFFAESPALAPLFRRAAGVLDRWSGEPVSAYQAAIVAARTARPPVRRRIRHVSGALPFRSASDYAANDQKSIWNARVLLAPWHYAFGVRTNKVRAAFATDAIR